MDIVFIDQLKLDTIIGIHDWERQQTQVVILDIEMGCSIQAAASSDNIDDSIDYFSVCERMKKLAQEHSFQLVEAFIEAAASIILNDYGAQWTRIKFSKPDAVNEAENVGVIIERTARR